MARRVLIPLLLVLGLLVALALRFGTSTTPSESPSPQPPIQGERPVAGTTLAEDPSHLQRVRDSAPSLTPAPLSIRVQDLDGAAPAGWWIEVHADEVHADEGSVDKGSADEPSHPPARRGVTVLRGGGERSVELTADARASHARLVLVAKSLQEGDVPYGESDEFVVDAATRGPLTLVTAPPTWLLVLVEGPRPRGELSYEVEPLARGPEPRARQRRAARTDASVVHFDVAHAVPYLVRARGKHADDVVEARIPALARGAGETVVLRFPGGLVEPPPADYAEVALTGRVECDARAEAGLWAAIDGGAPISIRVRDGGHFELVAPRGLEVELHAAGGELEARFDPEVSTHRFGARDVVLRCTQQTPRVDVNLRVVALETGEPLDGAWVRLERRAGDRVRSLSLGSQPRGEFGARIPALPDVSYLVVGPGRRDAEGVLFPDGAPPAGTTFERTFALETGFRREFRVIHCSDHTPISGATLAHEGRVLGLTDAQGRLLVELDAWPSRVSAEALGFDAATWPPSWMVPVAISTIPLCPAD